MAMLATLATYLEVPASAQLDGQGVAIMGVVTAKSFCRMYFGSSQYLSGPTSRDDRASCRLKVVMLVNRLDPNFNGTYDLGPMQVNTTWMPATRPSMARECANCEGLGA